MPLWLRLDHGMSGFSNKMNLTILNKRLVFIISLIGFLASIIMLYRGGEPAKNSVARVTSSRINSKYNGYSSDDQKKDPIPIVDPVLNHKVDTKWQSLDPNTFALNEHLGQDLGLSDAQLGPLNAVVRKLKLKALTFLQETRARFEYDDGSGMGFLLMPDQESWTGYELEFEHDLHGILDPKQYELFRERSRSALDVWTGAFGQRPRYVSVHKPTIEKDDWFFSLTTGPLASPASGGSFSIPENYNVESFVDSFTMAVPNYKAIGERIQGSFSKSQIPEILSTLIE